MHIAKIRQLILEKNFDINFSEFIFNIDYLNKFKHSKIRKYIIKDIPWFALEIKFKNKILKLFNKFDESRYMFYNKIITEGIYNRKLKDIKSNLRKLVYTFKNDIKYRKIRLLMI